MVCRLCRGRLKKFLDLGTTPLPEEFRQKQNTDPVIKYPLNLCFCLNCHHIQLGFVVPPDLIYKKNYFYDYSVTKTGLKHWVGLAGKIRKDHKLSGKDLVIDIGSNTGTLLGEFKALGIGILGVDPSTKLANIAKKNNIPTINDYFSAKVASNIVKKYGQAKVITCTNVFDHVDDLTDFVKGVCILLKKDGVFIIEVPYFLTMLKTLNHIVYHQQIDYITLKPLIPFLKQFGLKIMDAEKIPMHGGSIRIHIGFANSKSKRLIQILKQEKLTKNALEKFAKAVLKQKKELTTLIKKLKKENKHIAGIGASAKGITLLNYCGLDSRHIDFITEKSPLKIGRVTPTGIPIVPDKNLLAQRPDYGLLLAYNFQNEIIINLKGYKKSGGKFIIPTKLKII